MDPQDLHASVQELVQAQRRLPLSAGGIQSDEIYLASNTANSVRHAMACR